LLRHSNGNSYSTTGKPSLIANPGSFGAILTELAAR
jgi:hypothetical protein